MLTRDTVVLKLTIAVLVCVVSLADAQSGSQTPAEWKAVEAALGRSGKVQPNGAFRFGMPRKDLKVTVGDVQIKPGFALGAWAAFSSGGDNAMVMGDLVLTEDELPSVMAKLQQGRIEITAVHNHLQHETADHVHAYGRSRGGGKTGRDHSRCTCRYRNASRESCRRHAED